jgi:hypothetical protein
MAQIAVWILQYGSSCVPVPVPAQSSTQTVVCAWYGTTTTKIRATTSKKKVARRASPVRIHRSAGKAGST